MPEALHDPPYERLDTGESANVSYPLVLPRIRSVARDKRRRLRTSSPSGFSLLFASAFAGLFVATAGCPDRSGGAGPPGPSPPLAFSAAPTSPPPASTALPPLGGSWSEELPVEGFGDATVSVPLGATSLRPVMIGVHGRGDRPGWACGSWRGVTNAYPFILCPHGVPAHAGPNVGLAFADAPRLRREIEGGAQAAHPR